MKWLVLLLLAVYPFGQLLSVQVTSSARLHAIDLIVSAISLIWLYKTKFSIPRLKVARGLLSFIGVAGFSLVLGSLSLGIDAFVTGALYLARFTIYVFFYLALQREIKEGRIKQEKLQTSLLVVGTFFSIFGLVQYALFPDTKLLSEYGWDNHYYRLIGTLLDPAFTGVVVVLFLSLLLVQPLKSKKDLGFKFLLFALGWTALALTYSRASYLAAAAMLASLFVIRRNLKIFLGGVVLLVATVFLVPHPQNSAGTDLTRTSTITARVTNYNSTQNLISRNPLFGIGYNLYGPVANLSSQKITHLGAGIHSSPLFILVTTGVVGSLVLGATAIYIFISGWKRRRNQYGAALVCSSAAILTHSLFDNSLVYSWVLLWFGIILALNQEVKSK